MTVPEFKFTVDEKTGCWECRDRYIDKDGYPQCRYKGRSMTASRYLYIKNNGELPRDVVVRHKCDNRICINPSHLETGSQADNIHDRDTRGAGPPRGTKNGRNKLDPKDVYDIKYKLKKYNNSEIAKIFDVNDATIRDIRRGKIWKHI